MTDDQSQDHSVWLFYLLAFGWTWLFWGPLALAEQGLISLPENLPDFLAGGNLAAWGPLLASLLLTYFNGGWAGVRDLLRQGVRVRFGAFWYAVALLLFPVLIGGAGWLAQLAGVALPASPAFAEPISIPISFVVIFFTGLMAPHAIAARWVASFAITIVRSCRLKSGPDEVFWHYGSVGKTLILYSPHEHDASVILLRG